jgi:hypothetical protein
MWFFNPPNVVSLVCDRRGVAARARNVTAIQTLQQVRIDGDASQLLAIALEGEPVQHVAMAEFPDLLAAKAWYDRRRRHGLIALQGLCRTRP